MGKQPQRPPELCRIILPVKDIKKASTFYSKLLDLEGKKVSPGRVIRVIRVIVRIARTL
jgi:predicted enzyme related to lactoylglutathione lyase